MVRCRIRSVRQLDRGFRILIAVAHHQLDKAALSLGQLDDNQSRGAGGDWVVAPADEPRVEWRKGLAEVRGGYDQEWGCGA